MLLANVAPPDDRATRHYLFVGRIGSDTLAERDGDELNSGHLAGRGWPYRWPVAVFVAGVLVTIGLTLVAASLNSNNEKRLLNLRAKEAESSLTSVLSAIQTPLASAAALADATHGDPRRFAHLVSPYVGSGGQHPFVSVSLWRVVHPERGPLAVVGTAPRLNPSMPETARFLSKAASSSGLSVLGILNGPSPRLGYAFNGFAAGPYVAYGESALPANRFSQVPPGSAFSDLNFSLYLGRSTHQRDLLLTTVDHLPLPGRHARVAAPFGDRFLTVVVSPRHALGGSLPRDLPWLIAIVGALMTAAVSLLTVWLVRGRRQAMRLAGENERLYGEQREVAQSLQHALLPEALPHLAGVEVAARYEAGVQGIDIGGDWYDLIPLDQERMLLVVGDVSGRGVRAATAMASLRFAIHYAAQDEAPEVFLPKLSSVRELRSAGQLATVLCAVINLRTREVKLTSAGHLPLLMLGGGRSQLLQPEIGPPVGVDPGARYPAKTFVAPQGATLLAFTDGLVERRGEVIDEGLERLQRAATLNGHHSLEGLIEDVLHDVRGPDSGDDTVIAGIRWSR
jgi:hypothetical protein